MVVDYTHVRNQEDDELNDVFRGYPIVSWMHVSSTHTATIRIWAFACKDDSMSGLPRGLGATR